MDRVYKSDIPAIKKTLDELAMEFSGIDFKTDWLRLRIEPLREHVGRLERLLLSPKFARETSRLTRGVSMFHSDLVYFRENVKTLKLILKSGKISDPVKPGIRKSKRTKPNAIRKV